MSITTRYGRFFVLWSIVCLLIPMTANAHEITAPAAAARMARAAGNFLDALSSGQKKAARFTFEDDERFNWHYVPRSRKGLALKDMTSDQRRIAMQFLKVALSQSGYLKASNIIALESVLREIETWNWLGRDPEKYYFSFFGQPSETGTWGWRFEGHHLSLNITIVKGNLFATAPRFLGANPAQVAAGNLKGLRPLEKEELLARTLVKRLNREQQIKAVFSDRAYRDILTAGDAQVSAPDLVGISAGELDESQLELLVGLIAEYASVLPDEIASQRMGTIGRSSWDRIYFGWAGGLEAGQPHYYRIQGPDFLIEYDNVQNGANHIHTVWRDFDGDFGRDLLREHYDAAHQ